MNKLSRRQQRPPLVGATLHRDPCFGARLVQEGNQLHYLADRPVSEGSSATRMHTIWTRLFPADETTGTHAHQR